MCATQSVELPPMTGVTRMCQYVVLLVNKFHYWLAGSKKITHVVESFLLYKRNDLITKTLVFPVKQK